MTLGSKQELFAELVGRLLTQAVAMGYKVRLGEVFRPKETAELYAKEGRGIKNSLHTQKLAIDIMLFKNGEYLESTADYEPLGRWWECQDVLCRWGGRFQDGGHYSLEHDGRR